MNILSLLVCFMQAKSELYVSDYINTLRLPFSLKLKIAFNFSTLVFLMIL